jgi:hypothetical protein
MMHRCCLCRRLINQSLRCACAASQLPTWAQLRQLGVGFWLRDPKLLASTAEQLAKQQFAERRCADDCALLYCALGKRSVLQVRFSAGCPSTTTAPGASAVPIHKLVWWCRGAGPVPQHPEP